MNSPAERNPNTICRSYFSLLRNDSCEAGIQYQELAEQLGGKLADMRAVCMGRAPGCPKYAPYTAEEIAVQERAEVAKVENRVRAREAIVTKSCGKRNVWGAIPCPICGEGRLKYSVSLFGAHIAAKCTTPDCIKFNEN
jgi:hypothetical protein